MGFADLDFNEKVFADSILSAGMKDGSIRGTASHVITMNVYDNGRLVFRGFDIVDRKHAEEKIVEPEDVKIMMDRIIHGMQTNEYTEEERNKLLGLETDETVQESSVVESYDLPSGDGKGVDIEKAKEKFFS